MNPPGRITRTLRLLPTASLNLQPDFNHAFWLRVFVPFNAPAGSCRGPLEYRELFGSYCRQIETHLRENGWLLKDGTYRVAANIGEDCLGAISGNANHITPGMVDMASCRFVMQLGSDFPPLTVPRRCAGRGTSFRRRG